MRQRILSTVLLAAVAIGAWFTLIAARCPGKCPLCPP